jgi:hypothetical protein
MRTPICPLAEALRLALIDLRKAASTHHHDASVDREWRQW